MKKRLLLIVCAFIMVLALAIPAQAGTPAVNLDSKALTFDVPPVVEEGRTLVPLRAIFEALGAEVNWDDATQTVTAKKGDVTIKLVIGGKAFKNDAEVTLDVPAKLVDGRTLVPLRFVSESLGAKVDWVAETETVNITSAPAEEPKTEEPAAEEPATEEPAAEEPAAEEPAAQEPATPEATPFEQYLNELPYDKYILEGVDKEAQFIITGENAGEYAVHFYNGTVTWKKGKATTPAVTVTTTEKTWLDVASRKIDPIATLMDGGFAVDGDLETFKELKDAYLKKAQ